MDNLLVYAQYSKSQQAQALEKPQHPKTVFLAKTWWSGNQKQTSKYHWTPVKRAVQRPCAADFNLFQALVDAKQEYK